MDDGHNSNYAGGPDAHGWDPLVSTDAGVYDGLQEAPWYVYLKGRVSGVHLCSNGWARGVRRSTSNGLEPQTRLHTPEV